MNDLTGKELGGALEHLRQVSKVWLPKMADTYYEAATEIRNAGGNDDWYFRRSEDFGGSAGFSNSMQLWRQLCAVTEGALGDSANNYAYAGEVMAQAMEDYADTDDAASAELERQRDKLEGEDDPGFHEFERGYRSYYPPEGESDPRDK